MRHLVVNLCIKLNIFFFNSPHKLQVHVSTQQHQAAAVLFNHLQRMESTIPEDKRLYQCILCKFTSKTKRGLMDHVRTMKHLQMEQIHQLQKRAEGNTSQTEIGDIFQVVEDTADDSSEQESKGIILAFFVFYPWEGK